jgi:exonuclease III
VSLLLWNCEGLRNIYDTIHLQYFHSFDIILLTETFLLTKFSIPGFRIENIYATKSDLGRPKHGISIYYNEKLGNLKSSSILQNFVVLNFDHLSVVCSYLNPNLKPDVLWEQLINSMEHVENQKNLIYAGDFNCRIDKKNTKGETILEFANYNDLVLANPTPYQPTYVYARMGAALLI